MSIKRTFNIYLAILFLCYLLSYIGSPTTYPILLLLTGNGRFDDWWNTISAINKYPEVTESICTLPWVYASILKLGASKLGAFFFHVIYVIFSIVIFTIAFQPLAAKYGRFYACIVILSYPIIFGFWRGNTDFLIYGLIAASYIYGKKRGGEFSYSLWFLGAAIAFKPYQIFYLFAYDSKVLIKNSLTIILGAITIALLVYFGNSNFIGQFKDFLLCGQWYNNSYAIGDAGSLHNNSLWGAFKFFLYVLKKDLIKQGLIIQGFSFYLKFWPIFTIIIYLASIKYFKLFKSDDNFFSARFFLISILVAMLSPITPDYRLFLITICLIILLLNETLEHLSFNAIFITLLFITLPKEFYWFEFGIVRLTSNGPLNFIAMLLLFLYIVFNNLKEDRRVNKK